MKDEGHLRSLEPSGFTRLALAQLTDQGVTAGGGQAPRVSVAAWSERVVNLPAGATHFGFVSEGTPVLSGRAGSFTLTPGMYFALPDGGSVGGGQGLLVSQEGYCGFFHLGGPVEEQGRLCYIDGCTDSLLVPPVVKGDPCLNLLHVPPHTRQTPHTHPSLRVGFIVRGQGYCLTRYETVSLTTGDVFIIQPGSRHSFHTESCVLAIIAYHPDSDFGPTHEDHPMINRTTIEEQSGETP